jgi:hypothetical protein
MRERKAIMIERSDAFVAMPGGIGTLEELAELMTLNQLGYESKPSAFSTLGDSGGPSWPSWNTSLTRLPEARPAGPGRGGCRSGTAPGPVGIRPAGYCAQVDLIRPPIAPPRRT